ncbi:alpha/beta-hydrolase [Heliocybe sulcata]|uniref:Carboxypeptidase n=1 Tax=Heliocybe sulcata TaxID=5364 RepID=A0A5C3NLM9_9AGAM|nr:alpha/beta-hydrolase [Heliocybe sulcata]
MLLRTLVPVVLSASAVLALDPRIERLRAPKFRLEDDAASTSVPALKRSDSANQFYTPKFSNSETASFHVNSSALPLVTWELQDSWAGRLPISNSSSESRELFFWYWPSSQSTSSEFLTIWLNGGPGCSSLEGFLEENGPVSFQPGSSAPVQNPYAWTTVSDVVWIEQPVGTGFTTGTPNINNEDELADQFYGFLEQFFALFPELTSKKLFITGESYAGFYIPYIATRIVDASSAEKAKLPLALQGLLINDGVYSSYITSEQAPIANFSAVHQSTLGFTDAQVASFQSKAESCGYQTILDQLTYPPKGKIDLPNGNKDTVSRSCDLFDQFYDEAYDANSCFDIYRIMDKCPTPSDHIEDYFSRSDVQTLLHVPGFGQWSECSNENVFVNGNDDSPYTETLFPHLLSTLPRGITLWHGLDDAILFSLGDRITIQNLTWNGVQGFQSPPSTPLLLDGTQKGIYHSERNLTYIEVNSAGHMIPEDQPQLALHVFESVLGLTSL